MKVRITADSGDQWPVKSIPNVSTTAVASQLSATYHEGERVEGTVSRSEHHVQDRYI